MRTCSNTPCDLLYITRLTRGNKLLICQKLVQQSDQEDPDDPDGENTTKDFTELTEDMMTCCFLAFRATVPVPAAVGSVQFSLHLNTGAES